MKQTNKENLKPFLSIKAPLMVPTFGMLAWGCLFYTLEKNAGWSYENPEIEQEKNFFFLQGFPPASEATLGGPNPFLGTLGVIPTAIYKAKFFSFGTPLVFKVEKLLTPETFLAKDQKLHYGTPLVSKVERFLVMKIFLQKKTFFFQGTLSLTANFFLAAFFVWKLAARIPLVPPRLLGPLPGSFDHIGGCLG